PYVASMSQHGAAPLAGSRVPQPNLGIGTPRGQRLAVGGEGDPVNPLLGPFRLVNCLAGADFPPQKFPGSPCAQLFSVTRERDGNEVLGRAVKQLLDLLAGSRFP